MDIYGPFPLTQASVQTLVTRTLPGVALLCNSGNEVQVLTRSDHDLAEVLVQWSNRFQTFFFCYTKDGAQAERVQIWLARHLGLKDESEKVVSIEPFREKNNDNVIAFPRSGEGTPGADGRRL